ncbi:MAG: inositol monophosphatase [Candidatus Kerfeldbacteria bacterium]|nr:inositol monophosphatase [Candidatus Kerfeldbacteria bacterium]
MIYRDFIVESLRQASELARKKFGHVTGTVKPNDANQILTEADLAIGQLLIERIQKGFPNDNIIDEESGVINKGSERTWVIDPIDGTSNFAAGVPTYGILIGVLQNDIPVAGGASLPHFEEFYVAEKGQGAYCNGKNISVTREPHLRNALVSYGIDFFPEQPKRLDEEINILSDLITQIRNLRISNSVFDVVMVATGKYGGYLNRSGKIWDSVALHVILEEAGGTYTDFWGRSIDYSNALRRTSEGYTWCIAPPQLHIQLQAIIHKQSH